MSHQCLVDIALKFFEGLATPRALTCAILLRSGAYDDLLALRVDPKHYTERDCEKLWADISATEFLRKCRDLPTSVDKVAKAKEAFFEAELACLRTNIRLDKFVHDGLYDPGDERIRSVLLRARKICRTLLGPIPKILYPRFGPGATASDPGRFATVCHKMSSKPSMTSGAWPFLLDWVSTQWFKSLAHEFPDRSDPDRVRGNRFTTVPKDSEKDRGICIEPSINVFYQLGVGSAIRQRLRRFGIDLNTAQALHRQIAREGSRSGEICTIDLSSASDTVAYKLVKALLPSDWFDLLDSLRSPMTFMDGKWIHLQKFSSMGNGYTFELETLVFLCLILAVCPDLMAGVDVHVFGDDIIVPSRVSGLVISCLRYFGFKCNARKTFVDGGFRESCGGDYFFGVPVRGHYLKEPPNEPQDWIALANGLYRLGSFATERFDRLRRAWFAVQEQLPSYVRKCRGPVGLGDAVIHDAPAHLAQYSRTKDSIVYWRGYVPVPRRIPLRRFKAETQLAAALYGVPSEGVIPRSAISGYRVTWLAYS
jgi:hypothetical protein